MRLPLIAFIKRVAYLIHCQLGFVVINSKLARKINTLLTSVMRNVSTHDGDVDTAVDDSAGSFVKKLIKYVFVEI